MNSGVTSACAVPQALVAFDRIARYQLCLGIPFYGQKERWGRGLRHSCNLAKASLKKGNRKEISSDIHIPDHEETNLRGCYKKLWRWGADGLPESQFRTETAPGFRRSSKHNHKQTKQNSNKKQKPKTNKSQKQQPSCAITCPGETDAAKTIRDVCHRRVEMHTHPFRWQALDPR